MNSPGGRDTGERDDPLLRPDCGGNWIECVLSIMGRDAEIGEPSFTAHAIFAHKVLGETWHGAFGLASAYRNRRLSVEDCLWLRSEWALEKWGFWAEDPPALRRVWGQS